MEPFRVREYLRVSRDRRRTERSPDQQHADNLRAIIRRGWLPHPEPPYRDTDRSASRYAQHDREDFKRLIADLESDRFDAEVLALWESSRGSRRVGEWVDLIDLCRKRSVRIWVTTHERLYDLDNARDRRTLLEDAIDAEYESDKTSQRIRRSMRAAAESGRPHSWSVYGYRRIYDQETRTLLRVEPHPDQAPVVQEAAERVLRGDSYTAIARDFNARGIPPRSAKRLPPLEAFGWTPSAIKAMLQTPTYAGKRTLRGKIVADGIWEPLIEPETWNRLQASMISDSRAPSGDNAATHLLSGIARCGVCGAALRPGKQNVTARTLDEHGLPAPRKTYRYYVCTGVLGRPAPGEKKAYHVGMKEVLLDEIVTDLVFERLKRPDFLVAKGARNDEIIAERLALLDEIAAHEEYLRNVRTQGASERRFDLVLDQEQRVMPLLDALHKRLQTLSPIAPFVKTLLGDGLSRDRWESLDLADRRRVIRAVVVPKVHRVRHGMSGRRGRNADRVEVVWR